jgi:hypothetical protein
MPARTPTRIGILILTDFQIIIPHSSTIIVQICQVKDIHHIDACTVHLKLIRTEKSIRLEYYRSITGHP